MENGIPDQIRAGYTLSSFITTSATQDIFELVLARAVLTPAGEHPRIVHLWWRAPLQNNRLVQVYVDEKLYDVTSDATTREVYLDLDRTQQHRIELLAISADDPDAVWRPQPGLLESWHPKVSSTVNINLVRDETLPVDTQLMISLDGDETEYGSIWPPSEARAGSLSEAGITYGGAFGLGLGIGELGSGPLGYDGTAWQWFRDDLSAGNHNAQITAMDQAGSPVSAPLDVTLLTEQLPSPATGLSIIPPFGIAWDTADEAN